MLRPLLLACLVCATLALAPAPLSAAGTAKPVVQPPKMTTYVAPEYPKALFTKGLRGTVVVQLVVEADGSVGKVDVVTSAGPEFDAAAVAAAKKLKFAPATVDGKPTRVAIRFRYRFAPEMRVDRRGAARGLGRYDRRGIERVPGTFSSLTGRLVERGTGRAIAGYLVTLPGLKRETVSESDGSFRFGLLPKGSHALYVPGTDHRAVRRRVTIRDGKTTELTLRPERKSYTVYRATAEAPPEPGEMARRSLSVEEIQKIPGVNGDAFKVVQNLPGVGRPPGGAGFIVVRGSAPGDTKVYVEGVEIPGLYHFAGIYSIFNTDMLAGIDFQPGGYAVKYGRGTGGVLGARLALPREDERWTGYVESNVFHTGLYLKGPLTEKTTLTVAARRSYIDVVLDTVLPDGVLPLSVAPVYYDGQVKLDHRFSERLNLSVFAFGSADTLALTLDEPPAAFPAARGNLETATRFVGVLGVLRYQGKEWTSKTTLGNVVSSQNFGLGDAFRFDLTTNKVTLRQQFTFGTGPVQLRTGMDWVWNPFTIQVLAPPVTTGGPPTGPSQFIEQKGSEYQPAVWVDAVFKLRKDLEVVPGVRVDFFRKLANDQTFTPRLNVRWQANPDLTLKGATGTNSQQPAPNFLAAAPFGNNALTAQRSWESAVGFEYKLTDFLDIDMQGFYKRLWDIPTPTEGLFPAVPFANSGTGTITGLEVLLRHKLANNFFGWISYTLQNARRVDRPGAKEKPFSFDQTHILTILGSYKLPYNMELGLRWRYVTGNPQTGLATAVWGEQLDNYTQVRSTCENCERLPAFHQLDIRFDKKFVFDRWLLGVYLDLQNAYNRGNPEGIQYNFDATQSQPLTGLPIIPSFGIRAEF